jgi:thioredoxin-like negative regulator of GroEL
MRSELRRLLMTCALVVCGAAFAEPLVGPAVGDANALVAEGTRLYNKRRYADASELFLKATRANPSLLPAYLGLARSRMGAKDLAAACTAYRAYVRGAPDVQDRSKAQRELQLCERQLKAASRKKRAPPVQDLTGRHVELKAAYFSALEDGRLVGPDSAGEMLRTLVTEGYLGADLGEMGLRLNAACRATTDSLHRGALAGEALPAERLGQVRELFALAADTGEPVAQAAAQTAFLEGMGALQAGDSGKAERLFAQAAQAAPGRAEYRLWRAKALQRGGDLRGALAVMEAELPDDSRTDVLRAAVAAQGSPEAGARELERILFQRYPTAPR